MAVVEGGSSSWSALLSPLLSHCSLHFSLSAGSPMIPSGSPWVFPKNSVLRVAPFTLRAAKSARRLLEVTSADSSDGDDDGDDGLILAMC